MSKVQRPLHITVLGTSVPKWYAPVCRVKIWSALI
nr:MAG TPA: hypothetical protein [Caudoviricetes sp.]DAW02896.1 MAG TPA: hypothetical protein [Caudoviricetes sp.]